jgi:hypothetical protein
MGEYIEEEEKMDPLVKPEDDEVLGEDDGGLGGRMGVWGEDGGIFWGGDGEILGGG